MKFWLTSITCVLASIVIVAAAPAKEVTKVLCFPGVVIPKGKRIAAMRIEVFTARISAFPKIPPDWHLSLQLNGAFSAKVCGNCEHGAGGLDSAKELDGVIAASAEDWSQVKVQGVVFVTEDFEHLEEIRVDDASTEFSPPNQALEHNDPSCHAGCCAPVAPAGVVAHL
jgi:hypothetical protein